MLLIAALRRRPSNEENGVRGEAITGHGGGRAVLIGTDSGRSCGCLSRPVHAVLRRATCTHGVPWSIIGGNIVSATVGVACAGWIADPIGAAALAVSLAICAMLALRCVRPPSGAVALTAVLGGPAVHVLGYRFVAEPIAIQSVMLLCAAIVYHAATKHRYPHVAQGPGKGAAAFSAAANEGFTRADLEGVGRMESAETALYQSAPGY